MQQPFRPFQLLIHDTLVAFEKPAVMAIININGDSFYSGSRTEQDALLTVCEKHLQAGATFLDLGAQSSRPGATEMPVEQEAEVLAQAVTQIRKEFPDALLSIDSYRKPALEAALQAGAHVINNIGVDDNDATIAPLAVQYRVPYITMHMRGNPQNMTMKTDYQNVVQEVIKGLAEKVRLLRQHGVADVMVDPGFGFAKTIAQNYELLQNLGWTHLLDAPLLVGISRKSMLYKMLKTTPEAALNATTAANTIALQQGVSILRVHDVKEAVEAIAVWERTFPITP